MLAINKTLLLDLSTLLKTVTADNVFGFNVVTLLLSLVGAIGLCGRFHWHNPSKMPATSYVTKDRIRVNTSVEMCYWLSASDKPYADNRAVLRPYSEGYKRTLKSGKTRSADHPMGYAFSEGPHLRDNGGSIPGNLLVFPNMQNDTAYNKGCRDGGLPIHPARINPGVPNFFIRFLSQKWDLICDTCAGSIVTGREAESLDRYWVASDIYREYVQGGAFRFPHGRIIAGNRAA